MKGGAHEDENTKDKDDGRDEDSRSTAAENSHTDGEKVQLGNPKSSSSLPLSPKDSTPKSSASARRALFARRRFDTPTLAPAGGPNSSSTQTVTARIEPPPPRSPSPRPHQSPPSSLSPSSCHVSTAPQRPISPVRGLSPIIVQSLGSLSSGLPGSLADTSAHCQARLQPRDQASTARLVSHICLQQFLISFLCLSQNSAVYNYHWPKCGFCSDCILHTPLFV